MEMVDQWRMINARIPMYAGLQEIEIDQGAIAAIHPQSTQAPGLVDPAIPTLNLAGDWISLGGIDLQINGALGLAFPDLSPQHCNKLNSICTYLWEKGVEAFLPTLVTTSIENIHRTLSTLAKFVAVSFPMPHSSSILGIHLEGPFLNPSKRGAHPQEHLQPLTVDRVKRVLGDYASLVKVITLAPELDETGGVIPYLRSLGITVSLGHSLATAEQAQRAFDQGATMVTHAFNAMPPLHHRESGLLGTAITHPMVQCGLIADGEHVTPIMIDILLRASGYDQGIFLVSDALAPLGLPDGFYPWDTRQIEVKNGTARLPDGTLSGTTLPLLVGVQNLVRWGICEPETAIALATTAPRHAIGLATDFVGQPAAHFLRWRQPKPGSLTWERLEI
jgi:N-acetylglucosamine-6-phosphate deacetylase